MADYLAQNFSVARTEEELSSPANQFLRADLAGELVGYAKLHQGTAPEFVTGDRPVELSQIYVSADQQGHGVGRALMQGCIDAARESGCETMWLGVWERNSKAQAFYRRWGFRKVGTQSFLLGADVQTDWVMELDLSNPN